MPMLPAVAAITAVIPVLRPALRKILRLTEEAVPAPKSGLDKLDLAMQISRIIIDKLKARRDIDPDLSLTDDGLAGIIETVLAEMKSSGSLSSPSQDLPVTVLMIRGEVVQLLEEPMR